jgi:hypothetical protein
MPTLGVSLTSDLAGAAVAIAVFCSGCADAVDAVGGDNTFTGSEFSFWEGFCAEGVDGAVAAGVTAGAGAGAVDGATAAAVEGDATVAAGVAAFAGAGAAAQGVDAACFNRI